MEAEERDVVKAIALLDEASFLIGVPEERISPWSILQTLLFLRESSWAKMAETTGIDKTLLSRYCSGSIKPQKTNLKKIADFFKIPVDVLRAMIWKDGS